MPAYKPRTGNRRLSSLVATPRPPAWLAHLTDRRAWRPRALMDEFDASLQHMSHEPLSVQSVHGLRYFFFDGVFSAVSANFYANFVGLFALAYGASNAQIGQLTAIGSLLAALALFPGAWAIGVVGRRKPIALYSGGVIGRLMLLVWAFVPLFARSPATAIWWIIALNGIISFTNNFGNPAWTSMVADIVPLSMRGRYFSVRNLMMTLMALLVLPLAGWLISAGNRTPGLPFAGYQLVFLLAFGTGMISSYSFSRIQETPDPAASAGRRNLAAGLRILGRTPGFVGFVASAFIWNIGVQIGGPFFNVYLVDVLGATTSQVGLLTSVTSVTALLSQPFLGRLTDRKGNLWMQAVMGLIIPIMPMAWLIVRAPWHVAFINLASGVLWTGYNLANFNLLLEMAPAEARADAAALYQFVVAGAAVLAPLAGGYLADSMGYKLVFALSGAGRWLGIFVFLWLTVWPALRAARKNGASSMTRSNESRG